MAPIQTAEQWLARIGPMSTDSVWFDSLYLCLDLKLRFRFLKFKACSIYLGNIPEATVKEERDWNATDTHICNLNVKMLTEAINEVV